LRGDGRGWRPDGDAWISREIRRTEETYTSFLGTGWGFPPQFTRSGEVVMTSDEDDIAASLKILFGTEAGERFFVPKYGLDMRALLFNPISTTMATLLKDRIKLAILIWEPRIQLMKLDIDLSEQYEGKVILIIEYEIRGTNSRYNMVYPFYFMEGTEGKRLA
jgi:phage baseplate assembly protein W